MYLLTLFIFLISVPAFAQTKDLVHSAGASVYTVSSESELQDSDQRKILTFKPNVSAGTGIRLETEHLGLGYAFSGKDAQNKKQEKSKFSDIKINFHYGNFDFRLNYQYYHGALIEAGGKEEFYKDYEVKSKNGRVHYYSNKEHLNFIRDGRKLVNRLVENNGFHYSQSWFVGLNVDSRSIELPQNLIAEHQARVTKSGINYDSSFRAFSAGPLVGYDGFIQYNSAFFRGKFGAGPAFQTGGSTVPQIELGINLGLAFFKHHLISVFADLYSLSFKDDDQRISNNNVQTGLSYTYAFN